MCIHCAQCKAAASSLGARAWQRSVVCMAMLPSTICRPSRSRFLQIVLAAFLPACWRGASERRRCRHLTDGTCFSRSCHHIEKLSPKSLLVTLLFGSPLLALTFTSLLAVLAALFVSTKCQCYCLKLTHGQVNVHQTEQTDLIMHLYAYTGCWPSYVCSC